MDSFISDCRYMVKMMRATVRDENDQPLGFWEKLGVAVQVLCGIIVIEHTVKGKER